jgi:hypothetical protein
MSLTLTEETVLRQLHEAVAGTWEDLRHLNIDDEDDRLAFAEHLASVNGSPRLRVLLREAAAVLDRLGVPVRVPEL